MFKYPAKKRLVQAKDDTLDARALAVTMAIMTQVHVSRVRYGHSKKLYRTAAKHFSIQQGIVKQTRSSFAEGQVSEQTLIREEMNTLASQVASDIAYADLQNAYANIYASMGIDPYADDLRADDTVDGLADDLRDVWIERGDKSGSVRARRAVKDHVVTGSVQKPVNPKKVDPIVAETHGWSELEKKPDTKVDPLLDESQTLSEEIDNSQFDSDIVQVEDRPTRSLWKRFVAANKKSASMRVDLDQ